MRIFCRWPTACVGGLTAGSMVRAYYNPDYPIMSCLLPGYHKLGVYLPLAFGLFCVAVAGIELRARYLIR